MRLPDWGSYPVVVHTLTCNYFGGNLLLETNVYIPLRLIFFIIFFFVLIKYLPIYQIFILASAALSYRSGLGARSTALRPTILKNLHSRVLRHATAAWFLRASHFRIGRELAFFFVGYFRCRTKFHIILSFLSVIFSVSFHAVG